MLLHIIELKPINNNEIKAPQRKYNKLKHTIIKNKQIVEEHVSKNSYLSDQKPFATT